MNALQAVCLTYNCGKHLQDAQLFSEVIDKALPILIEEVDLLIVSVQEAAPIYEATINSIEKYKAPVYEGIELALHKFGNGSFNRVASVWNGAVGLIVYSRLQTTIVNTETVSLGYGWSSLKGAACVQLQIDDHRLTLIGAHLTANEGHVAGRNNDWGIIAQDLNLSNYRGNVIAMGDFNYRRASSGEDELSREMAADRTFWGFSEAEITFEPTYKYEEGTNTYNQKRTPSWCDRILWTDGTPSIYTSIEYQASDHRPVTLRLSVPESDQLKSLQGAKVYPSPRPTITGMSDAFIAAGLFAATTKTGQVLAAMVLGCLIYELMI